MAQTFLEIFANKKPILAMLHLKGADDAEVMERLKREVDLYVEGGVDAVIVENYFGGYRHVEAGLSYVREQRLPIPYGVNCLGCDAMGFELAMRYEAAFVQVDSVVGHVQAEVEDVWQAFFDLYRERYNGKLLGGVRFKYQPVLSKNSVEEDLAIGKGRCDAVCVTQDQTGQETSLSKITQFQKALGDFPLIVGAGVTPENMARQFACADGAVVGSYFKEGHKDTGEVVAEYVAQIVAKAREIREAMG